MTATAVVDGQWGDTGKGKIANYLVPLLNATCVARYNGGPNSGHTVKINDIILRLHMVPCGITYPNVLNVVGNGMVINPEVFVGEMNEITSKGYEIRERSADGYGNLLISTKAHLIMPWHLTLEEEIEQAKGDRMVGTTKRGIGPAYMSKVEREAVRFFDIDSQERFETRVKEVTQTRRNQFGLQLKKIAPFIFEDSENALVKERLEAAIGSYFGEVYSKAAETYKYCQQLLPYVGDCTGALLDAMDRGENVIFEGAQGTLLDVDHGTVPNVTSSNATVGGIVTGTGVPLKRIDTIVGTSKAYTTRVGNGAFPTELNDEVGERIRKVGDEFGTTTGRSRRVGWIDTVILRYADSINGFDELAITKLDVLGGLDKVKICYAYEIDGTEVTDFPTDETVLKRAIPKYETYKGWPYMTSQEYISSAKNGGFLKEIDTYLDRLYEEVGVSITMVSVGSERDETVLLK